MFQNIAKVEKADSLYIDLLVNDAVTCQGLLDSGSMATTINEETECRLLDVCGTHGPDDQHTNVLLVSCGGVQVGPKCINQLKIVVYRHSVSVPTLVVPGQKDQLIIITNVIKYVLSQINKSLSCWCVMSQSNSARDPEVFEYAVWS